MPQFNLNWTRYNDFFDLWTNNKQTIPLLYVIGDTGLCYIGSIGGRGGKGGIEKRYQKQYLDRSQVIFGSRQPTAQPAFGATITMPSSVSKTDILRVEQKLQYVFASNPTYAPNACFRAPKTGNTYTLVNAGSLPSFLPANVP